MKEVMSFLSTNASLNYLEKLYNQFGTWELALAAYNAGEGKVAREIKKNKRRKRAYRLLYY